MFGYYEESYYERSCINFWVDICLFHVAGKDSLRWHSSITDDAMLNFSADRVYKGLVGGRPSPCEFHCWLSCRRKSAWRRTGKVGIRILGAPSLLCPLQSCLKVFFSNCLESFTSRISLLVPNLPLSTTSSIDSGSLQPLLLLQAQGTVQFRLSLWRFWVIAPDT